MFPSIARNGIGKPIGRGLDDTWAEMRRRANLPETMTSHGLHGCHDAYRNISPQRPLTANVTD